VCVERKTAARPRSRARGRAGSSRKQLDETSACDARLSRRRSLLKPSRPDYAVNEEPQPQPPVAFGFLKVKPEPMTFVT
jgi:hypothetical protein